MKNVRVGPVLGVRGLAGICKALPGRAETLGKVAFRIVPKRFLNVVKDDNSNGSALLGYVTAIVRPANKDVRIRNSALRSVGKGTLTRCHKGGINCLFRGFRLLSGLANERGVLLPASLRKMSRTRDERQLGRLTICLRVASILSGFPSGVSNNRHRHITTTETLVLRPRVVLTSRPANTLSSGGTGDLVRGLSNLGHSRRTAVLVMARSSGTTDFYGHVLFVRSNIVFRRLQHKSRDRRRFCKHVLGIVTRLKKNDTGILWSRSSRRPPRPGKGQSIFRLPNSFRYYLLRSSFRLRSEYGTLFTRGKR